jgi:hypothetical protein
VFVASAAVALLVVFPLAAMSGAAPRTARTTVRDFYRFHFAHEMGFTAGAVRQKRRWIASALYRLLLEEMEKQKSKPADEAPYINGDPFTDSQEYPNSFQVGKANYSGAQAEVSVLFDWKDKGKSVRKRTILVKLTREKNEWRIVNLVYEDGRDLVTDLKRDH